MYSEGAKVLKKQKVKPLKLSETCIPMIFQTSNMGKQLENVSISKKV